MATTTNTITLPSATSISLTSLDRTSDSPITLQQRVPERQESGIDAEEPGPTSAQDDHIDSLQGWFTVAASSAIFFTYLGITYSFGIIQLDLAKAHLANVSTLSFVGSLAAAISPLGSILVARIIRKIGHQATAFLGSFLVGLGELTASWATKSLPALFITQGLIFGIGAGLCFLPAATVPSLWFAKKRGLATGIVYSGAGIGAAVVAVSLDKLILTVGIENALRVLGGSAWAICLPASYFVRPPPGKKTSVHSIQWRLFKSLKFCILLGMGALATFPLFVAPFLLPLFANAIGLSNGTGALILAGWNLASALGRVVMGVGADTILGPVNSLTLSLTVAGISTMALWPVSTSVGTLVTFALLNGAGSGGFFSLMPVVAGQVFGADVMANALSMLVSAWTFGYFMGSPIAGYILDAAGYGGDKRDISSFRPAIFYAGSLTLASAGLVLTVRLMISRNILAKV